MRRILALIPATALGLALASPAVGAEGDPWVTDPGTSAASLRNLVGVGVHLAYDDTPYSDPTKVASALSDLGVTHVRDDLFLDDPAQYAAMHTVAARSGARFDLIMGRPGNGHTPGDYVATATSQLSDIVESVEGPNEWDVNGGSSWVADLRAFQSGLFGAMKDVAPSIPVLSPALASTSDYDALGDLRGLADVANAHTYPGGQKPSTNLDDALSTVRAHTGVQTTVISETGYHTGTVSPSGHPGVPEDVQATYTPRLLLEDALRGVSRTYLYELVDEFSTAGVSDEASFGLLHRDWTPKPAYTALKNTLGLIGTPGASDGLAYRLTGTTGDVRHLLVDRADGTHVLFLWRDASVYDSTTRTKVDPGSVPVTLAVPSATMLSTYRPTGSAVALTSAPASSLSLPVDGDVTAVVLGGPQVPVQAAPVSTHPTTSPLPIAVPKLPAPLKPPKVITVIPGVRALALSWQVPAGSPLDGVSVTVGGRTVNVSPANRSVRLGGLKPGRTYQLLVRGWSGGAGSRVTMIAAKTRSR